MAEEIHYQVARKLAVALNEVREAGFHLMISDDDQGFLEYVLQEPGHFGGWRNVASVAWVEDDQEYQVVFYT